MKMRMKLTRKRKCSGGAFIRPRKKKLVPVKEKKKMEKKEKKES